MNSPNIVSNKQKKQLKEDGFFITDILFDENVLGPVRAEFQRFWNERIEASQQHDARTQEQARYRPFMARLHEGSGICDAFCRHEVFAQLCRELVGADADMTWNQAIIKPPAPIDNAFSWHQDMWYAMDGYHEDCNLEILQAPDTSFTVWAAISRTTVENGTLWVLPGRHKEGLLPHVKHPERRDWEGQFDTAGKIPAVLRAGQMLIFNKYLPHASGPNVSNEVRMAYQIGYSVPGVKLGPSPDLVPVLRDGEPV